MPARRVSRKKITSVTEEKEISNQVNSIVEQPQTDDSTNDPIVFSNEKLLPFMMKKQDKSVDVMERVKSKIELFDSNEHSQLLPAILRTYGQLICDKDMINTEVEHIALKKFEEQVTQNQNGIFLNLTNCSDELWQACVYCVDQIERQNTNLDMLDKERQTEMEKIRSSQAIIG